jgi:hypothetical protein
MKRKNQPYRVVDGKACVRRINLDESMRQLLTASFNRFLTWQGENVSVFGVDLIWEGAVSSRHNQGEHIHYLVVTAQGFAPPTAEEFDRVFLHGMEPDRSTS